MSDHDAPFDPMTPDPVDRAYAQAEAMLSDEAARAARRARVLAAVAGEAEAPPSAEAAPAPRRRPWRRGGWLVAASVAGVGVFLATQVYLPTLSPQPAAPPPPAEVPAPADRGIAAAQTQAAPAPAAPSAAEPPAPKAAPPPVAVARRAAKPASAPAEPLPAAAREIAEAAAPAPAAADNSISEIVVTSEKRAAARADLSAINPATRLRDAAAAGRAPEVTALLAAKGVEVDAVDEAGDTALMKAVQADQPAVAALLRRRGASLDRKNRAGVSARDMAAAIGDAELNRALGLSP